MIVGALLAIWWLERHPDLEVGYGILIFGTSWIMAITGVYMTLRECWP